MIHFKLPIIQLVGQIIFHTHQKKKKKSLILQNKILNKVYILISFLIIYYLHIMKIKIKNNLEFLGLIKTY